MTRPTILAVDAVCGKRLCVELFACGVPLDRARRSRRTQRSLPAARPQGQAWSGTSTRCCGTVCLNTAVRLRMIATNPCAGRSVKLPRSTREEMLFLTPTEIVALADEISRDLEVLSESALLHDVSSWRGTSFRVAARAF